MTIEQLAIQALSLVALAMAVACIIEKKIKINAKRRKKKA